MFQVISSIISFTFNVVYLPSVFQIISALSCFLVRSPSILMHIYIPVSSKKQATSFAMFVYPAKIVRVRKSDLWTFRDLDFSRVVLSRPMIGPFAARYFSHLFDLSRFATSVIFAFCCQLTVNYLLTTSCIQ